MYARGAFSTSDCMAQHSSSTRVSRLSRRLLTGIGVGFVAILLTLAVVGSALYQSLQAIRRDMDLAANTEEPESAATYEMEINALGAGLAVKKYLLGADAAELERLAKDEADFERFRAEYERLGDGEIELEMAREIGALHQRYRTLGRELLRLGDQRTALHAQLAADIEEVDRIFTGVEFSEPQREVKYRELLSLKADIGELGTWVGAFLTGSHEPSRQHVSEDVANVREHGSKLRDMLQTPTERETADRLMGAVDRIAGGVGAIVEVGDALRGRLAEFGRVRDEIDALIDDRIQARTRAELQAAHDSVRANLRRVLWMSLMLVGLAALVSLGAAASIGWQSLRLRDVSVDELRASLSRLIASEGLRGALLKRLVSAQEEERARIARELHDQFSQDLSALSLGLASVARTVGAPGGGAAAQQEVRALQEIVGRLAHEVHFVAWNLRPAVLDDLGLHGALSNLAEAWTRRSGVPIDLYCQGGDRLASERETTLYRVAQEALTNIAKHARARSVSIVLQREDNDVRLVVEDDGRGFDTSPTRGDDASPGRLGLVGMQERLAQFGGSLEIDSAPGKGTTIVARIPGGAAGEGSLP